MLFKLFANDYVPEVGLFLRVEVLMPPSTCHGQIQYKPCKYEQHLDQGMSISLPYIYNCDMVVVLNFQWIIKGLIEAGDTLALII
ncbi:hypothetical protein GGH92_006283 [Coemansia sp. RSA 2673]|nr:hypothetical protein GGH13_009962 [Coemansia sp. S155-1]KAJ2340395.1 hypothetical protein GGH92_006283 [Coemansia sp. RSA 2673]